MKEKNIKTTQTENTVSREDIQLYRLFCIFGIAILNFLFLHFTPERIFSKVLRYGQWVALALLVVTIGGYIYLHFVKKIDESGRVFTTKGIAYFLIPFFFMLAAYRTFDDANLKFQIAFAFIALFGIIYNIFKKEFAFLSGVTFLSVMALYYEKITTYNWLENTIAVIAKIFVFAVPVLLIAYLIYSRVSSKKTKYTLDKVNFIALLIMCALILAAALLLLFLPTAFIYVVTSLLVAYVIIGIVCTIKVM